MISFNKSDNSMLEVLLNEKGIYYFDKDSKLQIDQPGYIDAFNILKRIESSNIDLITREILNYLLIIAM